MRTAIARASRAFAFAVASVALTASIDARAYCRATTCDPNQGEQCDRNDEGCVRTGAGLRWRTLPIPYRFDRRGTEKLDEARAREAVRRAFDHWSSVECNGERTSLAFVEGDDLAGPSDAFAIHFDDESWDHDDRQDESLALTNQRYGKNTGLIDFADIEINTATVPFTLDGNEAGIDLETVVTHEVGHYIGLAHSTSEGSIMAPRYCQGQSACGQPALSDDDRAAVCILYPPAHPGGGGEGHLAPVPAASGGCSISAPAATDARAWVLALATLTTLALARWKKSLSSNREPSRASR